jgi:hypothetical protein
VHCYTQGSGGEVLRSHPGGGSVSTRRRTPKFLPGGVATGQAAPVAWPA